MDKPVDEFSTLIPHDFVAQEITLKNNHLVLPILQIVLTVF